jgi:branched-chain amino acid transport system ATP-binding protein
MLEITNVNAAYGHLQVLWDVSMTVPEGGFIALIGPNGAGKTTTLNTIAGLIRPSSGEIELMDVPLAGLPAYEVSQMGVSLVPQDLNLFAGMSVIDNLILGAYANRRDKQKVSQSLDFVFDLFPVLADRKKQLAGTLSGGERKMLALGRGLMAEPKVLLVDEPSLGLAPLLVKAVFEALQELNRRGITILLVEQNVRATLKMAQYGYVLEQGHIVLQGNSSDLLEGQHVREAYLGV